MTTQSKSSSTKKNKFCFKEKENSIKNSKLLSELPDQVFQKPKQTVKKSQTYKLKPIFFFYYRPKFKVKTKKRFLSVNV